MSNQASDDEKIAPEWMNERFFEDILRETEKVTQVISKPGSNLGDHYASVMFRGLVTYKNSKSANLETSLIIKTMPFLDGPKRDLLQQSPIFNIEVSIYSDILPNFEKHLKDANDDCKLGCKCLFYSLHPHKTIVFEDLTKRQFYAPEPEQMTYDTAMKALEKLAKWHAISFKINKENGEISKQFGNGPFSNYFLES
uniref:CHK kinase-like domain-containing protein n=1 Tax=Megaselia scalaris TaxID=36166 RepID=T1H5K8_MEGSC